jgi:DNA polymerase III epsilon subunit-like protein
MQGDLLRFNKDAVLVFTDLETFNLCLNFCHNLPWQASALKVVGDKSIDERDFYIKWDTKLKISADAARITRFNPRTIETMGKPPEEVFRQLYEWYESCDYLVGHNILGFDIYLIAEWYKLMNKPWKHLMNKVIDTNCLAKGLKMGRNKKPEESLLEYQYKCHHRVEKGVKTNLTALGKEYQIEHDYENLHNSLNDLQLNLLVWNKLKLSIDI